MHETTVNQAAGLIGLALPLGPRMMAMVSHGDEQAELPLLWRMCLTLTDYGYSVTVLDATTLESPSCPGLDQLLENNYWHGETGSDAPAWTVIPSGAGIQDLCASPGGAAQRLSRIAGLFPEDSVVILYSRADWMAPLMCDTGIEPLLVVSPAKASLLSSYRALKRLVVDGKLRPTIVNLTPTTGDGVMPVRNGAPSSLVECAKNFLGYEVKAIEINSAAAEDHTHTGAIQRLALRLMESALVLRSDAHAANRFTNPQPVASDRFARSH